MIMNREFTSDLAPSTAQEDLQFTRLPRLNLAIGPSCPLRCEGCYNSFGETAKLGGLVTAEEVVDFASDIRTMGVSRTTLSGGDPLFHPEITGILGGLKGLGYKIKLDTVGTALLGESRVVFKGKGTNSGVDVASIKDNVDNVCLPLDGIDQETIAKFRKGRRTLFQETQLIAGVLKDAGVSFGFNTVVNAANLHQVADIGRVASRLGASEWHIFEYDDSGPNPSRHKERLRISHEQFDDATAQLDKLSAEGMRIKPQNRETRTGIYFFVSDAGETWSPGSEGIPTQYGHITKDRERVLQAYRGYLDTLK